MNTKIWNIIQDHIDYMSEKYGDDLILAYGTGHIVYDDYNLDDSSVVFCIDATQAVLDDFNHPSAPAWLGRFSESLGRSILEDTLELLNKLLDIPECERFVWEEEDNCI